LKGGKGEGGIFHQSGRKCGEDVICVRSIFKKAGGKIESGRRNRGGIAKGNDKRRCGDEGNGKKLEQYLLQNVTSNSE